MGEKDSLERAGTGQVVQRNSAASFQNNTEFTRDRKTLEGWRLFGVLSRWVINRLRQAFVWNINLCSLGFGLLLAVLETSITATALVSISNHFGNSVNVGLHSLTPDKFKSDHCSRQHGWY